MEGLSFNLSSFTGIQLSMLWKSAPVFTISGLCNFSFSFFFFLKNIWEKRLPNITKPANNNKPQYDFLLGDSQSHCHLPVYA